MEFNRKKRNQMMVILLLSNSLYGSSDFYLNHNNHQIGILNKLMQVPDPALAISLFLAIAGFAIALMKLIKFKQVSFIFEGLELVAVPICLILMKVKYDYLLSHS